jgi:hypothetical protein
MSLPATAKWVLLALLGLTIAIGVAIAAANLTSQQIGIASESVSAGDALAPALSVPGERPPSGRGHDHEEEPSTTKPSEPTSPTGEAPEPPSGETGEPRDETGGDDSGGRGSDGDD